MAKKRYYNNPVSKKMLGEEYYAGLDNRMRHQLEDSGMISEDRNAIANLPQEWFMKPYPKADYARYHLDDTIRVVDNQMNDDTDSKEVKRGMFPEKY